MAADATRLLGGHFEDNAVGAYVMYSTGVRVEGNRFLRHRGSTGVGLALKESDDVLVRANLLAGNHVGLYVDGTPRLLGSRSEILDNVIAGNETGIQLLGSAARNVIAGNVLDGNALQVRAEGGRAGANRWSRGGRGNHWSDYAGLDLDGDGVGDQPYRARQWFEALEDRMPELAWLRGSIAAAAVDFAGRALPIFAPEVLLEDPHPLMRADVPATFRGAGPSLPFAAVSLALTAAGLAAMGAARPRSRRTAR
jgi:nitrous oxidase accessory protein